MKSMEVYFIVAAAIVTVYIIVASPLPSKTVHCPSDPESRNEAVDCFKEVKPDMDFEKLFTVPNYLTEQQEDTINECYGKKKGYISANGTFSLSLMKEYLSVNSTIPEELLPKTIEAINACSSGREELTHGNDILRCIGKEVFFICVGLE